MPAIGAIPPTPPIWGAAPPEVHSTLLNTGAGPEGVVAAGTSWTHVSAEYFSGIAELEGILASVQANYQGPSAEQFVMAHQPLLMWMADVAAKAALAAAAHGEIAASYVSAVATMPTMVELTANHAVHGALVGTNFMGVNTIPIGMNEADYIRMWNQAADVQSAYDGSTTMFVDGIPDTPPSPTTLIPGVGESGDVTASVASFTTTVAAGVSGAQLDLGDAIGTKLLVGQAGGQPAAAAQEGAAEAAARSETASNQSQQAGQQLKPDQASGVMQQFTQIASSAPQAASSAIQGPAQMLMQAPQQLASAPQQLSSLLSQFSGGGGNMATQGLGPIGFAGTAPVSGINPAGMTSLAGGALGGGPSRPMLPSTWGSAPSSVAIEETGARGISPVATGTPGAGAGGTGSGGSGMMGQGANSRRGKGSQRIATYSDDAVDEDADADSDGGAYAMSR
jgi:PPE-repeat protein